MRVGGDQFVDEGGRAVHRPSLARVLYLVVETGGDGLDVLHTEASGLVVGVGGGGGRDEG